MPQDGGRVWVSRPVGPLRLWRRRDGIPAPQGDSPLSGRAGGVILEQRSAGGILLVSLGTVQ